MTVSRSLDTCIRSIYCALQDPGGGAATNALHDAERALRYIPGHHRTHFKRAIQGIRESTSHHEIKGIDTLFDRYVKRNWPAEFGAKK